MSESQFAPILTPPDMSGGEPPAYLGVDSLASLDLARLVTATGASPGSFCTACLSGNYPVPVPLGDSKLALEDDLSIEAKENTLTIKGEKKTAEKAENADVLYRGIASRAFERRFQLADHVEVKGASLENGLLHVDLFREIPEAAKPRTIKIANGKVQKQVEAKVAA